MSGLRGVAVDIAQRKLSEEKEKVIPGET